MATVATESITTAGISPTMNAASGGGDKVSPDTILLIRNGSGSAMTVTVTTPGTVDGLAIADRVSSSIAAGALHTMLLPSALYRDPTDGLVSLAWSATTTITFASLRA
jgi:hypothetical protein